MINQLWSISKLEQLPVAIKRKVSFYAPLIYDLGHLGIGEAAFTRASTATPVWKDGGTHLVAVDVPRFEYGAGLPLGIALSAGELLSYHAGNRLDSGTLIWFEDNVVHVAPFNDLHPFSAGAWAGALDVHVKDVLHFRGELSDYEIGVVIGAMADVAQGPFVPNDWILEATSVLTATTRRLVRAPDLTTLLLSVDGILVKRVASSPGLMQFSIADQVLTLGAAFEGMPVMRALYRRNGLSGATFSIEDLAGTKDDVNLSFSVSQAPTDGVIILVWQGIALEKVVSAPELGQYTISGATITLGTDSDGAAPASTDDLWALLQTGGSGFSIENLTGTKNDSNTSFSISAAAVENVALIFHTGVSLTRVGSAPGTMEYTLSGTDVEVGTSPAATDGLWAFLRTS